MIRFCLLAATLGITLGTVARAQDLPPLEAYGRLPQYDLYELSPSGKRAAARVVQDGRDVLAVLDVDTRKYVMAADASRVNPRGIRFVEEDKVVLVAGQTVRGFNVRGGSYYFGHAYAMDLSDGDVRHLMTRAKGLYPYQSGLGTVVGRAPGSQTIYMPAFVGESAPDLGIFAVSLDRRRETLVARGNRHTVDWFLGADGKPLVREDFDDKANVHRIWRVSEKGRNEKLLYEEETELPHYGTVGITQKRDSLVLSTSSEYTGARSFYLLDLENGTITGPVLDGNGLDVGRVITDINRVVYGVEYAGFRPTYAFFDEALSRRVSGIQQRLPGLWSRLASWNSDFSRLLFEIEGVWTSGVYVVFEEGAPDPLTLGLLRPAIGKEHVAPVEATQYEADDGRLIPALVTSRQDVREAGNAPLIVMPHGGPRAHDEMRFDWIAQYFAGRGYVVLQPQYRGSTGFGHDHLVAGYGEYGGKMISDINDGVRHLVEQGIADPERVCAVGASYGGYAALALGAFSPDMYRCIVSIAGISDIPKKLSRAKIRSGREDSSIDYFERLYGIDESEKDSLRAISPAYFADAFVAPVLLIHGEKDTRVDIGQSTRMNRALRRADKDVTLIKLKGEDHWLTKEETRIEALRATAKFIEQHL